MKAITKSDVCESCQNIFIESSDGSNGFALGSFFDKPMWNAPDINMRFLAIGMLLKLLKENGGCQDCIDTIERVDNELGSVIAEGQEHKKTLDHLIELHDRKERNYDSVDMSFKELEARMEEENEKIYPIIEKQYTLAGLTPPNLPKLPTRSPPDTYPPKPPTYERQQITTDKQHVASLVLSIIGLVFALFLPIITYVCSIIGLVVAIKNRKEYKTTAAIIMCIIGLIVALINSIMGFLMFLAMI
ncbi:MAG: DUF4190 domain-containing protein [Oscillospiraceae bacterium]|nr:DUF4190 domain-containing protein [Oscillospiraceae bacterium]